MTAEDYHTRYLTGLTANLNSPLWYICSHVSAWLADTIRGHRRFPDRKKIAA